MVNELTDKDFERKVIRSTKPVLVDFWATWCVPCKMVAPIVDKLSTKYAGKVDFYKMNVEESPLTPAKYRVMSIPALILFKGGEAVDTMVGALPERTLVTHIDGVL
jgi:thioredoxin 1